MSRLPLTLATAGRIAASGFVGLVIGCFLTFAGVLAIENGGYGTQFFLLVYSAPSGFLPRGPLELVAAIALWTLLGSLAGAATSRVGRVALRVILLIHYGSIPFVLIAHWDEIGRGENFQEALSAGHLFLVLSIPMYVVAHRHLWLVVFRGRNK